MKTQVKTISGKLEETPVKLKVELQATLTELKNQLKSLHTKLVSSKSYEPIKIGVQIDVNGSVINIKRQLQQVQSTVEDFNKKYGKQLDQMQKLQIKAQEVAKKAEQASTKNISTKAGAQNFNNIKEYTQALADAEKHLKSTLPQGKQGFFSSKELKDAKGNLHGFVASLEKMNGVVESVSYQFDDAKQRFQIVDRKTLTATEKNLYSNMKALSKLGGELDKTGKKADVLFEAYEKLAVAGDEGKLDSQMIANFKSRVEMAKKETLEAEKKKKVRQEELLLLKKIMDASKGSDMRFNERTGSLVTKLSNSSGDAKLLQDATFEYKNLKKEIDDSKRALSEYEKVQRRASILERELNKLLREEADSSELLTTQNLKLALSRAKNAKTMDDLNRLEKKTAEFRANLDTTKDIRAREEAFLKLRKVMLANADLEGRESKQTERILQNIKENENTSLASLNSRIKTYERLNMKKRESLEIDRLNMKARSYVPEENGFSNKQLNSLISKGDFNEIREYIAQTQKLDLALAKVAENKKGITTITGTLKSTGKTTKQVTYEVDELTKKLRFMGSQEVFNRNANLGIFEQLKIAMARVPVWMASMTAFYGTIRGVQAMTNEILQLDKAMTELKRVASSNINMDIMFEGAVKMSGSLGANMHEVLNTMGEMARTFGDFNERQLLAITNTATLMANVSDLSVEEAGNNLVGTMNAFNLEAEDSIHIADALNEVNNISLPLQ
ncbi:MAG: phage tail tape measure protein [Gammaproteobacteria bacterium]